MKFLCMILTIEWLDTLKHTPKFCLRVSIPIDKIHLETRK